MRGTLTWRTAATSSATTEAVNAAHATQAITWIAPSSSVPSSGRVIASMTVSHVGQVSGAGRGATASSAVGTPMTNPASAMTAISPRMTSPAVRRVWGGVGAWVGVMVRLR